MEDKIGKLEMDHRDVYRSRAGRAVDESSRQRFCSAAGVFLQSRRSKTTRLFSFLSSLSDSPDREVGTTTTRCVEFWVQKASQF